MTGMRIGEASALHWNDINFEKAVISIKKSLHYKNASIYQFTSPKTKASRREVSIDDTTIALLKQWQKKQNQHFLTNLVLSHNRIPIQKNIISKAINRLSKKASIHRIRIHGLPHSHAAMLIQIGENPLAIKERL